MHWKLRVVSSALVWFVMGCDALFVGQLNDAPATLLAAGAPGIAGLPSAGAASPALMPTLPIEALTVPPSRLSETGLFDATTRLIAPGVASYAPAYELWSDSAEKHRWISLPPNTQIDSSNMDVWVFPVGTKLWKQFSREGRALETRYIARFGPGELDWVLISYQWNEAGTEAFAVPDGVQDAAGTPHNIPSTRECRICHNSRPAVALGFRSGARRI